MTINFKFGYEQVGGTKIKRVLVDNKYFGLLTEREANRFTLIVNTVPVAENLEGLIGVESWIRENYASM